MNYSFIVIGRKSEHSGNCYVIKDLRSDMGGCCCCTRETIEKLVRSGYAVCGAESWVDGKLQIQTMSLNGKPTKNSAGFGVSSVLRQVNTIIKGLKPEPNPNVLLPDKVKPLFLLDAVTINGISVQVSNFEVTDITYTYDVCLYSVEALQSLSSLLLCYPFYIAESPVSAKSYEQLVYLITTKGSVNLRLSINLPHMHTLGPDFWSGLSFGVIPFVRFDYHLDTDREWEQSRFESDEDFYLTSHNFTIYATIDVHNNNSITFSSSKALGSDLSSVNLPCSTFYNTAKIREFLSKFKVLVPPNKI